MGEFAMAPLFHPVGCISWIWISWLRGPEQRGHFLVAQDKFSGWGGGRVSSKQSNIFFGPNQNKPKLNLFRLFFGLFRETKKHFFGLFRCFGPVSKQPKQTEFSRNKPKQTKKIPKKTLSIRGYSKPLIFFLGSNRNSICFGCFSVCFFAKPNNFFFRFVSMFRTGIETTEKNKTYGIGN